MELSGGQGRGDSGISEDRLRAVLDGVLQFEEEDDGALTVHHDHTFA